MNSAAQETFCARLQDAIGKAPTDSAGIYNLLSDLIQLQAVRSVGATEAAIFYSARILEAQATEAVRRTGLSPSPSAYSNLETLMQFNLVPPSTLYWANGLRRLGNDVRHVLRKAEPRDAELAALFVERWIEWFFCRFRLGPRLPSVTRDGSPLFENQYSELREWIRSVDADDFDPGIWLPPKWTTGDPPYLAAPTFASVIANLLLDRGEVDQAFVVLDLARARFPDDLRLQQLAVLAWKRRGDLDQAVAQMTPLLTRIKDDDETAGIVGGVYKQIYLDRGRSAEILSKSHRAYSGGWESSKSCNVYLGINAAATALWLGRCDESRRIAAGVRDLLRKRITLMEGQIDGQVHAGSFWDEVTLGESHMLLGSLATGRQCYLAAFDHWTKSRGNVGVAKEQAQRNLAALGLMVSGEEFFAPRESVEKEQMYFGITGHRTLENETMVRAAVASAVGDVMKKRGESYCPVIISGLAAGADCLAAEVILEDFAGKLYAVLPLEIAEYRKDFHGKEADRFQKLVNRCDVISFSLPQFKPVRRRGEDPTPEISDRDDAYERVGNCIVDRCEILIAIWDGQPARGRGGTGDVVNYARKTQKPVIWINSRDGKIT